MKMFKCFASAAALAGLCVGAAALATPIGTAYVYTLGNSASVPSTGVSYATVTLTQTSATKVDVSVALASNYYFVQSGVGPTFAFNLDAPYKNAVVMVDGGNYTLDAYGGYEVSSAGKFTNGLELATSTGASGLVNAPLNFSVSLASGISLDAFVNSTARNKGQPGGYPFAADIGYLAPGANKVTTGSAYGAATYTVVDPTPTMPNEPTTPVLTSTPSGKANDVHDVPEPASLLLVGLGLLGMTTLRKRGKP